MHPACFALVADILVQACACAFLFKLNPIVSLPMKRKAESDHAEGANRAQTTVCTRPPQECVCEFCQRCLNVGELQTSSIPEIGDVVVNAQIHLGK